MGNNSTIHMSSNKTTWATTRLDHTMHKSNLHHNIVTLNSTIAMLWQSFLSISTCSVHMKRLTTLSPCFHLIMLMHDISGKGLECSELANFEMGGGGGTLPPYSEDISLVTRKCAWKIGTSSRAKQNMPLKLPLFTYHIFTPQSSHHLPKILDHEHTV